MVEYLSSEIDDLGEMMKNGGGGSSTLGSFMELLGFQHFNNTTPNFFSNFDHHNRNYNHGYDDQWPYQGKFLKVEVGWYQHQQQLMTPNCSTISSESSGGAQITNTFDYIRDKQHQRNSKTELKVKKSHDTKNMKGRQQQNKEARVAFMTRSDVDHLEDGFRWRKYGQKPVKNSPFPRSYYRCTNSSCNVKKRVERSLNDPTIVVTTYEGKHAHPSPKLMHHHHTPTAFAPPPQIQLPHNHRQYYYSNFGISSPLQNNNDMLVDTALDHGLLQDVVPSLLKKDYLVG